MICCSDADAVDDLLLGHGGQGGHGHDLGLAAGEHAGAVGTGQHADLAPDGAHLGQLAAVGTQAFVDDVAAHDFLLHVVQRVGDLLLAALKLLGKVLGHLGLHLLLAGVALGALEGLEHPLDLLQRVRADGFLHVLARQGQREFLLLLADLSDDAVDEGDGPRSS